MGIIDRLAKAEAIQTANDALAILDNAIKIHQE